MWNDGGTTRIEEKRVDIERCEMEFQFEYRLRAIVTLKLGNRGDTRRTTRPPHEDRPERIEGGHPALGQRREQSGCARRRKAVDSAQPTSRGYLGQQVLSAGFLLT